MGAVVFAILVAVFFLVGTVALLVWAIRGKRVDDHLLCRRCRFDLTGKPDTSTRCPECGRDVTGTRSVRVGNRQSRKGWAIVAALVLAATLCGAGAVGVAAYRRADLYGYAPEWWLEGQMGGGGKLASRATSELYRRARAGKLSDAQMGSVVERALAWQGDRKRRWDARAGVLVEWLFQQGRVSPARWSRYLEQLCELRIVARPRVAVGEDLPVDVYEDDRCGFLLENAYLRADVVGRGARPPVSADQTLILNFGGYPAPVPGSPPKPVTTLRVPSAYLGEPGRPTTLKLALTLEYYAKFSDMGIDEPRVPPVATARSQLQVTSEVLPKGEASARRATTRPGEAEQIRAAIKPETAEVDHVLGQARTVATLSVANSPCDLAYRVEFAGECESWDSDPLVGGKGRAFESMTVIRFKRGQAPPSKIVLKLVPDVEAAKSSVNVVEYSGVPMEVEVNVVSPPPATRPAR